MHLYVSGCKQNNVPVVYTAWANLKKTQNMDVGQVGFHRDKEVKTNLAKQIRNMS